MLNVYSNISIDFRGVLDHSTHMYIFLVPPTPNFSQMIFIDCNMYLFP